MRWGLSAEDARRRRWLVNLPTLRWIAAALLAGIHGRAGHGRRCCRFVAVGGALPPDSSIAEVLDLQKVARLSAEKR